MQIYGLARSQHKISDYPLAGLKNPCVKFFQLKDPDTGGLRQLLLASFKCG